jgi:hypothetical protein
MSLFKPGTKRYIIASMHASGLTERETYTELRQKVADQVRPWTFTRNTPSGRVAKPLPEQFIELQHEISRVYSVIARTGANPAQPMPTPAETPQRPVAKGKKGTWQEEMGKFIAEWERICKWIRDSAERNGNDPVDSIEGMRPVLDAKKAIKEGISAAHLAAVMALHWPTATREMAQIPTADFITESEDLGEEFHQVTGYVLKLAKARMNIMLVGPAGTGKSEICKQVASLIRTEDHPNGLPYAETAMSPGATRGDLLGRHTIGGMSEGFKALVHYMDTGEVLDIPESFVVSEFQRCYEFGGVFNLEEIDSADAGMLIVINNALAGKALYNAANGRHIPKHRDFICMSTGNTLGTGANAEFSGRTKLDGATLDRFRMGRVLVNLDTRLVKHLAMLDD